MCIKAAQLESQRPIGIHPSHPNQGAYHNPNNLILCRLSTDIPQGHSKRGQVLNIGLISSSTQSAEMLLLCKIAIASGVNGAKPS